MTDDKILKKMGKKYGREDLSIGDLEKATEICSKSQDFGKKTFSFNRQVLLEVFNCSSLKAIDQNDRRVLSGIIKKILTNENNEVKKNQSRERLQKQCGKDLKEEAKRAGFNEYDELDKHLTIH